MIKRFTFLIGLFLSGLVFAQCPQFYPDGKTIQPINSIELCNSFFVIQYDDVNKRNFFSSELLQPTGHDLVRKDTFHPDKRSTNNVKPYEYRGTGYDKGHMVPSDDSTTYEEMNDTFLMTNMTPQVPQLNRVAWKNLEEGVRKVIAASGKPGIVVTGAVYDTDARLPKGRVPIPSGYFKIIYPQGQKPSAFYADNNTVSRPHSVQILWINAKTSMKFPLE